MLIDTKAMASITEANQNFSRVARLVDEMGAVIILKNNHPRYVVLDIYKMQEINASDEDVLSISKRLLSGNKEACEMLSE